MGDASWKRFERETAKALGGYRTGPTGTDTTDVSGISVGIECKYQGKLSLRKGDLEQAKRNARELPWVLVLKEKRGETYAIVDFEFFVQMYKEWNGSI